MPQDHVYVPPPPPPAPTPPTLPPPAPLVAPGVKLRYWAFLASATTVAGLGVASVGAVPWPLTGGLVGVGVVGMLASAGPLLADVLHLVAAWRVWRDLAGWQADMYKAAIRAQTAHTAAVYGKRKDPPEDPPTKEEIPTFNQGVPTNDAARKVAAERAAQAPRTPPAPPQAARVPMQPATVARGYTALEDWLAAAPDDADEPPDVVTRAFTPELPEPRPTTVLPPLAYTEDMRRLVDMLADGDSTSVNTAPHGLTRKRWSRASDVLAGAGVIIKEPRMPLEWAGDWGQQAIMQERAALHRRVARVVEEWVKL